LNNDSEHSSSGDDTSRVIKWDGALIVEKRYSLMTIFEMDTVWSFLWMIMVNLTVADTRIQIQVLVKIKKCFRCRKNIFFDENYLSISGKYVPLDWATGKPHDCPERA
jgi:hypothetical protein